MARDKVKHKVAFNFIDDIEVIGRLLGGTGTIGEDVFITGIAKTVQEKTGVDLKVDEHGEIYSEGDTIFRGLPALTPDQIKALQRLGFRIYEMGEDDEDDEFLDPEEE